MRRSRYVVEATGSQGEHLVYNVANGAFARLQDQVYEAWRDGSCQGQAADALKSYGFLTEMSHDEELGRQRELFDRQRADTSSLTLSFVPTYACNFRCPYCYEKGHNKIKGTMDEAVMDAILAFVQFKFEQDGFSRLLVQWYGGDPSLALEQVARLSEQLISWAQCNGVSYDAMMLTNANTIGQAEAELMARCRISSVYLTIDGPEHIHNKRRVAANGSNSYERTIQAARHLRANGIALMATMNTDKVNIRHYDELYHKLLQEEGIELFMAKLNDYGHFFGDAPFCAPDFDLFTHEEFFRAQFDEYVKHEHHAGELREMLRPIGHFCNGQIDNYFVIDLLGDVYNCDGRVGDKPYVRFNLFDDRSTWKLRDVSFDATRDEKCSACELLPVCLGSCIWERSCSGMPCHPLRTTIGDYLRLYASLLDGMPELLPGLAVLAEPFSPAELGRDE